MLCSGGIGVTENQTSVQLCGSSGMICCSRDQIEINRSGGVRGCTCVKVRSWASAHRSHSEGLNPTARTKLCSAPVWLSLSRNWRRLPRLLPTPVCAAGAAVLCGDWGAATSIEGLPRKRAHYKSKQQQACDVRRLVSSAPAEPHLQRLSCENWSDQRTKHQTLLI